MSPALSKTLGIKISGVGDEFPGKTPAPGFSSVFLESITGRLGLT